MLTAKLKDWTYYYNKVPLYLKNCYGFTDHFDIIFQSLLAIDATEDIICKAFDITADDYENSIIRAYDRSVTQDQFKFLDMIGNLYGVTRTFNVHYTTVDKNQEIEEHDIQLHLTNSEFLKLIKCRIIQNNYDGSYQQTREYYDKMKMPVYMFQGPEPASVYVIVSTKLPDGSDFVMTENERHLFLANLLTIKSMGITYSTSIQDITTLAIWDSTKLERRWDKATWQ